VIRFLRRTFGVLSWAGMMGLAYAAQPTLGAWAVPCALIVTGLIIAYATAPGDRPGDY
jgi:hypothetical protein